MGRLQNASLRWIASAALAAMFAVPCLVPIASARVKHPAVAPAKTSAKKTAAKAEPNTAKAVAQHPVKEQRPAKEKTAARREAPTHTVRLAAKERPAPAKHEAVKVAAATPSKADYEAAQRVHAWEAAQKKAAESAPAPEEHTKATAADFLAASQISLQPAAPIVSEAPKQDAVEVAPVQPVTHKAAAPVKPVHDVVSAAKSANEKASDLPEKPLSPAIAKMLPGAKNASTPQLADAEASMSPMIAPAMVPLFYNKRGRLIMPAAMKGSHEILLHQNQMADAEGLDRIQDDEDLERKIANKQLVALPANKMLTVDERLPDNRRYCRPWVAQFLVDMARAHYARFHTPLQVNSAVRTVEFQVKLRRTNGNAAPSDGDTASPHLTGFAVDIGKKGMSTTEIAWTRGYLMPLMQQGKVDVEEEFQQACFHMSVYRKYVPGTAGPKRSQPAGSAMVATALN